MKGLRARLVTQAGSNLLTDAYPAIVNDYYQSIIDSVNSVIFTVDRELCIVGVNRQWDAFVLSNGYHHLVSERVLGTSVFSVLRHIGVTSLRRWRAACRRILGGQTSRYLDEIVREGQISWRHYTLAASPLEDSEGEILGITFVVTNITQLKKAEGEMLQRLIELRGLRQMAQIAGERFDQRAFYKRVTADIAHLFDAEKCIIFRWSDGSGDLQAQVPAFGLTERELADLSLDIGEPTDPLSLWLDMEEKDYILLNEGDDAPDNMVETAARVDKLAAMMAVLRVSGRVHGAILLAGRDTAFSDRDGQLLAAFAVQIVLAIESAELNQRLLNRTQRLSAVREELERMLKIVEALRMPLTVVRGYMELLLDGALGSLPKRQRPTVKMLFDKVLEVADSVDRLSPLQPLPNIARYEPVQLVDLVCRALDKWIPTVEETGLELIAQLPAPTDEISITIGDPDLLIKVFDALLNSAMSFSHNEGTIYVSLDESSEIVYVKIHSSGAVIPAHHLLQIWQSKAQTESEGSISLAEVKQIVEQHGGQVLAESQPERGSAFYVALPKLASGG
jgi:PAS domain S-box-containing protein